MRLYITFLAVVILGTAGCAASPTTDSPSPIGDASPSIEVVATGGFTALSIRDFVDRDSRAFIHVNRHICGSTCQAPIDSTSGIASAAAVDSLFDVVRAQKIKFQDDYGITRNGADMMDYVVKIQSGGVTKTIHADDGTIPDALRQIVAAVRSTTTRK